MSEQPFLGTKEHLTAGALLDAKGKCLPLGWTGSCCPALPPSRLSRLAITQPVISSVPYAINASGKYVLSGNLDQLAYEPAVTTRAPNVELDLGGFYVSGGADSSFSFIAVIFVQDVANVVIRNGLVANESVGISFEAQSTLATISSRT